MRIAVVSEVSARDKNAYILEALRGIDAEVFNVGMSDGVSEPELTYIHTGLMAALGINTFFTGNGATNMAVNSQLHSNVNLIAAGAVNGQNQANKGDNVTATAIGELASKKVTVSTTWKTVSNQSIGEYYATLVTTVGADRRLGKTNSEYHTALSTDLEDRVTSVTGVNLDEEMSNLIKFQHSYTAAAKLITTADQMLQTLLGLKE